MRCATTRILPALSAVPVLLFAAAATGAAMPQCGNASWYEFTGQTASGEPADPDGLTAAHPTLPFGIRVRVENLRNGESVIVRINDRGPHTGDRIIDVTRAAADLLGLVEAGIGMVRVSSVSGKGASSSCP